MDGDSQAKILARALLRKHCRRRLLVDGVAFRLAAQLDYHVSRVNPEMKSKWRSRLISGIEN